MYLQFAKDQWNLQDVTYAWSRRFPETPSFQQKDDYVENRCDPEVTYGYENISLLTKQKYGPGTTITTRCAYFEDGAPLIMLSDDLYTDENGNLRYDNYFEVVLYKNGINVWRLWNQDGKMVWHRRLGAEFPVSEGEIHELSVTTGPCELTITVDGAHKLVLRTEDIFPSYHVGIDACEGINRFWDMHVDGEIVE